MERQARTKLHRMDYGILLTVTLLCAFGLVMLFSATYYSAQNRAVTNYDGYYYLRRQVVYMLIAYPVMLLLSFSTTGGWNGSRSSASSSPSACWWRC